MIVLESAKQTQTTDIKRPLQIKLSLNFTIQAERFLTLNHHQHILNFWPSVSNEDDCSTLIENNLRLFNFNKAKKNSNIGITWTTLKLRLDFFIFFP